MSRRPREMYCGHARLCLSVCVSDRGHSEHQHKQTKPRFGRLLRPLAWKRSGSIFWKVRDRRRVIVYL